MCQLGAERWAHCLLLLPGALRNLAAVDASRTEMASDPSVGIVLVSPLAHLPPSAASSAAGSAASSFSSGPGAQRGNTRPPPGGSGSSSGGLLQHVMSTIGSPLVLLDVQIGEYITPFERLKPLPGAAQNTAHG